VHAAVLHAAFDELGEKGFGGFSMEAVARKSGVHKTTLYRRWPTREALVIDALDSSSDRHSPIPSTGSLRQDLRMFGHDVFTKLSSPHGKAMLKKPGGGGRCVTRDPRQGPELLARAT
jgi:AcrR family transcriptional regulator